MERQFDAIRDERWHSIDAGKSVESIHGEILATSLRVIEESSLKEIEPLWEKEH